jgi:hypothetical protein
VPTTDPQEVPVPANPHALSPPALGHPRPRRDWAAARAATVHCLVGCSIGEVLGLAVGQAAGLGKPATVALAVGLAFFSGILLATVRIRRGGLPWARALRVAVAAEFLSITTMEVVNNLIVVAVPGALDAGLADPLFWGSLAVALAVAFVVTLPVNAWLIARGRGHALDPSHRAAHPA